MSDGVGSFCLCVCVGGGVAHTCVFFCQSVAFHTITECNTHKCMSSSVCDSHKSYSTQAHTRGSNQPNASIKPSAVHYHPIPWLAAQLSQQVRLCLCVCSCQFLSVWFFFNMSASHMLFTPPFLSSPSFLFCSTFLASLRLLPLFLLFLSYSVCFL